MKKRNLYIIIPLIYIIAYIASCIFISYNNTSDDLKALEEHSKVISGDIWNLDKEGPKEYLTLAAKYDKYDNIKITTANKLFLEIPGPPLKALDEFLLDLGLIGKEVHRVNIMFGNRIIGSLRVIHLHDDIYPFLYIFIVFSLLYALTIFLIRLATANKALKESGEMLEARVIERTKELKDTVILLEKEIDERKKAKKALADSEEKYRSLYNSSRDAILVMEYDGNYISGNPAALELFGFVDEAHLRRYNPLELSADFQPDGSPAKEKSFEVREMVLKKGSHMFEWKHRRVDGSEFFAAILLSKVQLGEKVLLQASVRDISRQKMAEEALKESEERYRTIYNTSVDGILIFDSRGKIISANQAAYSIYGYNEPELIGMEGKDLIKKDYLKVFNELLSKLKDMGMFQLESVDVKKDGTVINVEIRGRSFVLHGENHLLSLVRDITERKIQERALRKAQNYISNIINSMPSVLIGVDKFGKVTQWNKAASETSGISPEEANGMNVTDVFPEISTEIEKIFESIQNREISAETNKPVKTKDGMRYEDITIYPLVTNGSEGAVIRIDDVTRQFELEQQLNQSRKMDAIGQLAGGVAHDFNNMLSAIMTAAELLMYMKDINDDKIELINMILKAARRAADLTAKLLAFSRKGNVSSTTIDIHKIILDAVAILERSIDKRITIKIENQAKNSMVVGDDASLQNALLNMGINSGHAMPDGGSLSFRTQNIYLNKDYCDVSIFSIEPGEYLEIEVRDTGEGISTENQKKIFEPFFTTKEQGKGTGLGLAAVYGTIQNHGGAITVYSEIGIGTVFHIYLPLSNSIKVKTRDETVFIHGSGTILLVDDEEIIRITTRSMLINLGYDVLLAENGKEAVEIYSKQHREIDLVMLDMIMPVMNGREAYHKIREINPECKVVISSGFSKDEDLKELKSKGLAGFIGKPYRKAELSRLLAKVLNS